MTNNIQVKVNFENPRRPKYFKKLNNRWVKIDEKEFCRLTGANV